MIDILLILGILVTLCVGFPLAVTRRTIEGCLAVLIATVVLVLLFVFAGMNHQSAACEEKGGTLVGGAQCIDDDAVID